MSLGDEDLADYRKLETRTFEDSRYAYTEQYDDFWEWNAPCPRVWRRSFEPIGVGGFGCVYREDCIDGRTKGAVRAVKHIQKAVAPGSLPRIDYGRELRAMAQFAGLRYAHRFVRSEGWYEMDDCICIVMDYYPHGNLQQYVGHGMPELDAKILLNQVLEGVVSMHNAGFTHGDMKPQNLLVVQPGPTWHIKITDFGLSKRLADDLSSSLTFAGTPGYMAPEIMRIRRAGGSNFNESISPENEYRSSYPKAVDVWAVGVVCFMLLTGRLPFPAYKTLRRFMRGKEPFPLQGLQARGISILGMDFVQYLLVPQPSRRPSADQCLQKSWLNSSRVVRFEVPYNRDLLCHMMEASTGSISWNTKETETATIVDPRKRYIDTTEQSHETLKETSLQLQSRMGLVSDDNFRSQNSQNASASKAGPASMSRPIEIAKDGKFSLMGRRNSETQHEIPRGELLPASFPQPTLRPYEGFTHAVIPTVERPRDAKVDGFTATTEQMNRRCWRRTIKKLLIPPAPEDSASFKKYTTLKWPDPYPHRRGKLAMTQCAFSPSGEIFAAMIPYNGIRMWRVATAMEICFLHDPQTLKQVSDRVRPCRMEFSPCGNRVAIGRHANDRDSLTNFQPLLTVYHIGTGTARLEFRLENSKVVRFLQDGQLAVVGPVDPRTVKPWVSPELENSLEVSFWDFEAKKRSSAFIIHLERPRNHIDQLAISPDGNTLAIMDVGSVRVEDRIIVHDLTECKSVTRLPFLGPIRSMRFSSDGQMLCVDVERSIELVNLATGESSNWAKMSDDTEMHAAVLSPENTHLVAWGGSLVEFHSLSDRSKFKAHVMNRDKVKEVLLSSCGSWLALGKAHRLADPYCIEIWGL